MSTTTDLILKHFPELTANQIDQLGRLKDLYIDWNSKINVISRKDTDNFYERHVLHSLAIAKIVDFKPDTQILDIGTGGGFPGIPLAILYPQCQFTLVDSIGKKIKVVNAIKDELQLKNVIAYHERGEKVKGKFDFIVSRAVTAMPTFLNWTKGKLKKEHKNELDNGILYLKGGDLTEEMKGINRSIQYYDLKDYFEGEFFETKKVVYIQA